MRKSAFIHVASFALVASLILFSRSAFAGTVCQTNYTLVLGQPKTMDISACYSSLTAHHAPPVSAIATKIISGQEIHGLTLTLKKPFTFAYGGQIMTFSEGEKIIVTMSNSLGGTETNNFIFSVKRPSN